MINYERIAALEVGLANCKPSDVGRNSQARYGLMQLYTTQKRYEEAINQGRLILQKGRVSNDLENNVRVELAFCLDSVGRAREAEAERMAVESNLLALPDSFGGWCARGKVLAKLHRHDAAAQAFEAGSESEWCRNCGKPRRGVVSPGARFVRCRLAREDDDVGRPGHRRQGSRSIGSTWRIDWPGWLRQTWGVSSRLTIIGSVRMRWRSKQANAQNISDCLAALADLHYLRGELDKAESMCLRGGIALPRLSADRRSWFTPSFCGARAVWTRPWPGLSKRAASACC